MIDLEVFVFLEELYAATGNINSGRKKNNPVTLKQIIFSFPE